jgi:protein SCO1/2
MLQSRPWTSESFRDVVASYESAPDRQSQWVTLLDESHDAYAQCSSLEVARRRGWLLSRLAALPVLDLALPFVQETLQTAHEPYLLAAASLALTRSTQPVSEDGAALLTALTILGARDDAVDLDVWAGLTDDEEATTCLAVALETLSWIAQRVPLDPTLLEYIGSMPALTDAQRDIVYQAIAAQKLRSGLFSDCCSPPLVSRRKFASSSANLQAVRFEDQDQTVRDWSSCLHGRTTVVAFFYTRCENPNKCSLTITRLGHLQKLVADADLCASVRIVAVSYDDSFDTPARLSRYVHDRGFKLDSNNLVLRVTQGGEEVRRYFSNGVNFVGTLVNWHRVELFVLDSRGEVVRNFERRAWTAEQVMHGLQEILAAGAVRHRFWQLTPAAWALLLALLPKCPICGATYLSVTGLAALPLLDDWTRLWPVALGMLLLNVFFLARAARISRRIAPVVVSGLGAVVIVGPGLAYGSSVAMGIGFALVLIGSLLSVFGLSARALPAAWGKLLVPRGH